MSAPEPPPTEAMLDGRYRLGECIGEGAMARVHRGEDVILGRTVAIKMFRPGVDTMTTPARARSETAVLASLNHPSLVTLFDAHLTPGRPEYMVMEFVAGPTLGERISEGLLPSDEVAHFAADLSEALHVVHSAGIVHRDIKPSNILLEQSPLPGGRFRAKLADFGIAWLIDSARVTTPGIIIGTAAYIAPEQVRGADPSTAADIYSLGLVLLEALTLDPPFPNAVGVETALARLASPPAIPVSVGPQWSRLLTRMTAMDPDQRPTAAEVAAEVSTFPTSAHVVSPRPTAVIAATVASAAETNSLPSTPTVELPLDTSSAHPVPDDHRPRRPGMVGAIAVAAAVTAIIAGVWAASLEGVPRPVASVGPEIGPAFQRLPEPSNPADDVPVSDDTVTVVPADSESGDDSRDQETAEQEQREAERAAENRAEEAQKEKAREDKRAEQAQKEKAREDKKTGQEAKNEQK